MLNARVEAQRGTPGPDGLVPITFTLQEGDVFTIRSVAIEGVSAAEQRTLLAEVTTKPKRTFSRAAADDDLRRVRVRVRAEKLHPRADVDVEPLTELDPKTKTVALRFEVSVREH